MTSSERIRVANAPCSWGAFEFDGGGEAAPACQRVLSEMSACGYAGTELGDWGFMPTEPAALAALLERYRLEMVGGFVPVALRHRVAHAEGIERAVKTAALMAEVAPKAFLVLSDDNGSDPVRTRLAGRIGPDHGMTDPEWKTFAEGATAIARAVREQTGLRTVFHHHCGGFVETTAEIDRLMASTDPALLGLVLDTGHVTYGGGDPLAVARRHADRIWHVHFKDCDPGTAAEVRREGLDYIDAVRRGIFCELGRGTVDFPGLLAHLRERRYPGWIVVEQDVFPGLGDPVACARRSRAYLSERGL